MTSSHTQRAASIIVAVVLALTAGACASTNPRPDAAVIGYTDGPIQGQHFKAVYQPASGLQWLGIFDGTYSYPTTVRTYIVSADPGEGDRASTDHITATTKDGVSVDWQLALTFKLNVSQLRTFHEQIGLSRRAWFKDDGAPSDGWSTMLNDFFRQALEGALQEVSRDFTTDQIAKDPATFIKISDTLGVSLKDRINRAAGGNFFCGPGFSGPVAENNTGVECPNMAVAIKRPALPANVVKSYEDQKVAENAKLTATNNGEAAVAEASKRQEAADKIKGLYSDPNYVAYIDSQARLECAKRPDCSQVNVTGAGAGVNVNTGGR
jgi:hypothetical protein